METGGSAHEERYKISPQLGHVRKCRLRSRYKPHSLEAFKCPPPPPLRFREALCLVQVSPLAV